MLDKLKSFAESAKIIVVVILIPIFVVFGYIYYLIQKINLLTTQAEEAKANEKIQGVQDKVNKSKVVADDSEAKFERLAEEYKKEHKHE